MKKLLSLLSVLTISGTAVPITIAASTYQKQNINNNLWNDDINYLQNNLENLKIKNKTKINFIDFNNEIPDLIYLNLRKKILNKNIDIKRRNVRKAIWKNSSHLVKNNIPRKSIKVLNISWIGAKICFRVKVDEKNVYFANKYVYFQEIK